MEGLDTVQDCDNLMAKIRKHRARLVLAEKKRVVQQIIDEHGEFEEELLTNGIRAYPILASETFTIDGMRWFFDNIIPNKSLRMGFCFMAKSHSWEVGPNGFIGKHDPEVYREWKRAFDFGFFLVRVWPNLTI